jgi:hypothetical protein
MKGSNDFEAQCIDANLNYFRLPYPRFKRIFEEKRFGTLEKSEGNESLCALQRHHQNM